MSAFTIVKFLKNIVNNHFHILGALKKTGDLEVCFINNFFDEDQAREEEDNDPVCLVKQNYSKEKTTPLTRSKSDWEAFKNPKLAIRY